MSATTSPQLELLRAKLALAIGPIECNLAYDEVRATRPNALDEPWSDDMSGPHKYVVFDNKAFVLFEVVNEQIASGMARGCPPIDMGENIKLYLNDVWQLDVFHIFGFDMATIRCPVTGRDPLGSLYYSLIQSVDECILKKVPGENRVKADGHLESGDVVMEEKGGEANEKEGAEEQIVNAIEQERQDGVNQMSIEVESHESTDAVMEG